MFLKWLVSRGLIVDTIKKYAGFDYNLTYISAFLIPPLFEEITFRLPLKKGLWNFTISGFLMFTFFSYILTYKLGFSFVLGAISGISIFFLHKWVALREILKKIYTKYFIVICAMSVIIYTLTHLPSPHITINEILFTVPVLFAGIIMTIIRIKINFWSGFIFHILLNSLLKICWFYYPFFFGIPI